MALKALMLRKKIDDKKKELEALRASNDFAKREAELEASINEAETDEETLEVLKLELNKALQDAGLTNVRGSGLTVVLEDSTKTIEGVYDLNAYLV